MTLKEMSAEYRAAAQPLRERHVSSDEQKATARSCSGSTGG